MKVLELLNALNDYRLHHEGKGNTMMVERAEKAIRIARMSGPTRPSTKEEKEKVAEAMMCSIYEVAGLRMPELDAEIKAVDMARIMMNLQVP